MKDDVISVVVPLYNKAEYVPRAIRSVLAQTEEHFELIVVDDGSTDNGLQRAAAFTDARIRLVRQANQGVSAARNRGVESASAEIVAFLDADDEWEQDFLQEIASLAEEYPDVGLYGVNQRIRLADGSEIVAELSELFGSAQRGLLDNYFRLFVRLGRSPFSSSSFAVRRSAFRAVGGYALNVRLTEDSDLWCRMALRYHVAFSVRSLSTYHMHTPGNTIDIPPEGDFEVAKSLRRALDEDAVRPEHRDGVRELVSLLDLRLVRRALSTGRPDVAKATLRRAYVWSRYPFQALAYRCLACAPEGCLKRLSRWRQAVRRH